MKSAYCIDCSNIDRFMNQLIKCTSKCTKKSLARVESS